MVAMVIPLAVRVPEAVATAVGPEAKPLRPVLVLALALVVAAIAVGPLVVETGALDRPMAFQT